MVRYSTLNSETPRQFNEARRPLEVQVTTGGYLLEQGVSYSEDCFDSET